MLGRGAGLFVSGGAPIEHGLFDRDTTASLKELSSEYGWPKFGHSAEARSLKAHVKLFDQVDDVPMDRTAFGIVLQALEDKFKFARAQPPPDFCERSHFDRAICSLDMSSSPGLPFCKMFTTNSLLFMKDGELLKDRVDMVWDLVRARIEECSPADPIRLFVKAEPIKKEKIEQGRYRLISSVSVVDQLVDQMVFGWQNQLFIDNWILSPTRVGWAPLVGGWKLLTPFMRMAIDKRAWDWTVKAWMIECELILRHRLADQHPGYVRLSSYRYQQLYKDAVLVTSGGVALKQRFVGVMKSGCVNTIVSNSILQCLLHYRVCYELNLDPGVLWSMGDDTLQTVVEEVGEYFQLLCKYCLAKKPEFRTEFAGFRFEDGRVEPMYLAKHAYNLLHFDPKLKEEMITAYSLLYARSVHRKFMEGVLSQLGELPSEDFLIAVWNGSDERSWEFKA